ncbi:beta-1,4-N-acetylgalactosaminyltransferase bre-4-like isoform X1 [Vespa mandarinia]|uniref:beta-1,4-N-acetylgalactosaminyltransferase bre-4-like isoform X1 n=2 Tax=Vespa mandarinia TaxID=7446 RepID=UPI00160CB799|nr:beta-1,4-N-acetylgalactosaminyltransferase bre-4-like isoform X1 [Vespa mandarinia]XP_046822076.1 beta-1,4-N-acetylgalactosaminyltransferase bre-4-like isoform X1 [Vespa crabro]XP_047350339.1 beta-1,4-N-acetylgalactosaminyltransferase bre-4-like isoform X1 [Vespa velutina]
MRIFINILKMFIAFLSDYARGLSYTVITILILCYCLHPARFASHYTFIKAEDIYDEMERSYPPRDNSCTIPISNERSSHLLYPEEHPREDPVAMARRLGILPGGQWKPLNCHPLFNVAIILPYRNRQTQLTIFMNYIHPFLQAQNLNYRIFVIEQSPMREFNRAKLFNVGYAEATKINDFHCFIFQDIDLIPQNPNNIYACTKMPRHMSSSVNTFRYNLPYTGLFGGAIALTRKQFERVNGFSNVFYGWGGEDDDFYSRLQSRGLQITRFGPDIAQYYMINHKKESPSSARFANLENAARRYDTDGISNLEYRVLNHQLRPLYSWILADV